MSEENVKVQSAASEGIDERGGFYSLRGNGAASNYPPLTPAHDTRRARDAAADAAAGDKLTSGSAGSQGRRTLQITVDASDLNDCSTGVDEADLILRLNGVEQSITLQRAGDSKFRSF